MVLPPNLGDGALVGPFTWQLTADRLRTRGFIAFAPVLLSEGLEPPYWLHHSVAITESIKDLSPTQSLVLVGHSGAGALLPAARMQIRHGVAGYIFVDAGLPGPDGANRLDMFESQETAERFRARAKDGRLPPWTSLVQMQAQDLERLIPDPAVRRRFLAELQPTPLAVYKEPLPVPADWPDAPCGYLKFSSAYEPAAQEAMQRGWPSIELPGGQFHMLIEPDGVADALVRVSQEMGILG